MVVSFVPLEWMERAGVGTVCHAYLIQMDQREVERRWFDRRMEARDNERRQSDRRSVDVERLVHTHLRDFCTTELGNTLDTKFGVRINRKAA